MASGIFNSISIGCTTVWFDLFDCQLIVIGQVKLDGLGKRTNGCCLEPITFENFVIDRRITTLWQIPLILILNILMFQVLFCETPCNPTMTLVDLEEIGKLGKSLGIITMVDSTFASSFNQKPIQHGIDVVIHSW